MNLSTNEFNDSPTPYEDESVTITPIPISPSSSTPAPETANPTFSFANAFSFPTPPLEGTEEEILAHKKDIVHEMFKRGVRSEDMDNEALSNQFDENRKRRAALMNVSLPPTTPSDITMAYFVKNRDSPGRFDLQKAQALKVPPGKLYSILKAGEDVEIPVVDEDGTTTMKTVKSEDVLGDPIRGKTVLILDIPGLQYVKKVVENDTLNSEVTKNADIVVHMLSDEVASDKRYIKWMESFQKSSNAYSLLTFLTIASGHGTEVNSRQFNFTRTVYVGSRPKFLRRFDIPTSPSRWRTYFNAKLVFKEIYTCTTISLSVQRRKVYHRCTAWQ
jgi:hypothetical protein